jgi:hypothetical protein
MGELGSEIEAPMAMVILFGHELDIAEHGRRASGLLRRRIERPDDSVMIF